MVARNDFEFVEADRSNGEFYVVVTTLRCSQPMAGNGSDETQNTILAIIGVRLLCHRFHSYFHFHLHYSQTPSFPTNVPMASNLFCSGKAGKSHNTGYLKRQRGNRLGHSTGVEGKKIEQRVRKLLGVF